MISGFGAIFAALANLEVYAKNRETKWLRFISMALTAVTLCLFYRMDAVYVRHQDWSALIDVVPGMSKIVWICTAGSIILNGITLLKRKRTE